MTPLFAPPADFALVGGRVITVNQRDEVVDAIAVKGNRIAAVGSRTEVERFIGPQTVVIDLGGRSAMPGFIENHIHMTNSPNRTWLDVGPGLVGSIDDIRALVSERAARTPAGGWILGHGYHPERLQEGRHPNRHDLDVVSQNHPVGLKHRESMSWTFNTLGLRRIGVQDDTPDPPGGPMHRDKTGEPLGPMFDNTRTAFIHPNLPVVTEDDLVEGYRWMCAELNRHGITSAHEASIRNPEEVTAWRRLREEGGQTVRVSLGPYPLFGADWDPDSTPTRMYQAGLYSGFGDEWIRMGSLTYGVDGGIFGQTMALFEPYSNDPAGQYRGSFRVKPDVADAFSMAAQKRGWQISAVSHGDHGISVALDAIEKAQSAYPENHLRHRLEHAYVWNPELLDRAASLGVVWNTQLPIMAAVGRWATHEAWGPRARYGFPVRSAMDRGIIVSGGSDWSVATLDPMVGIHALVTRRLEPLEDGDVLNPDEAVSMLDAIRTYTYNGAYSVFEEERKGSLEEGKLADIAVLSEDILSVPEDRIRELTAVMTMVDGKIVYETAGVLTRVRL
jgi:predicted amidohydrolase YtcJ